MSGRHECASCARGMTQGRVRRGGWVSVFQGGKRHAFYCHACSPAALEALPDGSTAYVLLTDPFRMARLRADLAPTPQLRRLSI